MMIYGLISYLFSAPYLTDLFYTEWIGKYFDEALKTEGLYEKIAKAVRESDDFETLKKKMLDAGSTTVWETELGAPDFANAGSLCHGWSAMPIYYYSKYKDEV